MRRAALALLAACPATALASGMYLPWWVEVLAFLLLTPVGWAVLALIVAALAVAAIKFWRRK